MKRIDLAKRLEKRTCPPRILFTADCDEGAERKFSCKVTVTGATVTGTQEEVFFNVRASRSVIPSSAMPSGSEYVIIHLCYENVYLIYLWYGELY